MRFNSPTSGSTRTTNHEGDTAYALTPALDLYSAVVTTALSGKFYEDADGRLARIRDLVSKNDPAFVAKLAVYAREQMYLRSVPLVLAVELAKVHSGDDLVGKTVARVVQRADEITELLAYYQTANARTGTKKLDKLSKQVQKGLAAAFNKFTEYQFAKYDREAAVKLKDALFLVHPRAKDDGQQALFDKIVAGTLETPYTWETQLSEAGKTGKDKQVVWEELIASDKLGYMALLRNLRNMLEAKVGREAIDAVASRLSDPEQVRKSKQFPFRFLSAYREIERVGSPDTAALLGALESAMVTAAENVEGFDRDTTVFISTDFSGSMGAPVSEKSSVQMYEVGLILAMLLRSRCKSVVTSIFGDRHQIVNFPHASGILANCMALKRDHDRDLVGSSTNAFLVPRYLLDQKLVVDKVMLFSDMQVWNSQGYGWGSRSAGDLARDWHAYKQFNPKAKLYLFDLQGYGNSPLSVHEKDVYFVAGWSEKVLSVLAALERGSSAVAEIEGIDL